MPNPALHALIYLRDLACHEHLQTYARRQRHRVIGVQHDPDGSKWLGFVEALLAGEYDVIIRCADLDPGRVPRVEIDPHPRPDDPDPVRPRRRRPRPI